jgi:hypothetical protein
MLFVRGLENCITFKTGATYEEEKAGNCARRICCQHRETVNGDAVNVKEREVRRKHSLCRARI